jgi:hypothetical protein
LCSARGPFGCIWKLLLHKTLPEHVMTLHSEHYLRILYLCYLFKDGVNNSDYIGRNVWWWLGKDNEGNVADIIWLNIHKYG